MKYSSVSGLTLIGLWLGGSILILFEIFGMYVHLLFPKKCWTSTKS